MAEVASTNRDGIVRIIANDDLEIDDASRLNVEERLVADDKSRPKKSEVISKLCENSDTLKITAPNHFDHDVDPRTPTCLTGTQLPEKSPSERDDSAYNVGYESLYEPKEGSGSEKRDYSQGEILSMLADVQKTQLLILEEVRSLKVDQRTCTLTLKENVEVNKRECQCYVDEQMRAMECRLHGVSAVLDHVQTRIMDSELKTDLSEIEQSSNSSEDNVESESIAQPIREDQARDWLRENHVHLVSNLNPRSDMLMDQLFQDHVLTSSDNEKILSHPARKDQARELVMKMRRRDGTQIRKFRKHLTKEYPHLSHLTDNDTGEITPDNDTGEIIDDRKCVVCCIKQSVDIDDVIDCLFQRGLLDEISYRDIWKSDLSDEGWCRLLRSLNRNTYCTEAFVEAIGGKYPGVAQRIATSGLESLICRCQVKLTT